MSRKLEVSLSHGHGLCDEGECDQGFKFNVIDPGDEQNLCSQHTKEKLMAFLAFEISEGDIFELAKVDEDKV